MKWTLRQRLTALFAGAIILPALLVGLVAYLANRDTTQRYGLKPELLAEQASTALDDRVKDAARELQRIASKLTPPPLAPGQDADALQALANSPERQRTARALGILAGLQDTFPVLVITDDQRLTYAEGRQDKYLDSSPGTLTEPGRIQSFQVPVAEIAKSGFAITHTLSFDTKIGPVTGFWLHVALPPPAPAPGADPATAEHLPTHYLSGFLNSDVLLEALRKQRVEGKATEETAKFTLYDANGKRLADSLPEPAAGTTEPAVRTDPTGVTLPAESLGTPAEPAPKAAPTPAPGFGGQVREAEVPSKLTGYVVRASVDSGRFEASHDSRGKVVLALLAGVAAAAALLAFPLARNFLAPMYKLLDGARAWQGGDHNFLFRGRQAEGEWAELAESMNGLAARIHAQRFEPRDMVPPPDLPSEPSTAPDSPLVQEAAHVKALLRAATETESEGLLITDQQGNLIYSNSVFWDTWEKAGGRPGLAPSNGSSAKRRLPLARMLRQTSKARANIRRLRDLATQPAMKLSGQVDLKDARRLQFSVRPYMMADEIKGRIWRFRDISARSRLEEEVRTSKQLMENLVENQPLALYVKDVRDEFRVILWNKAAENLYGIPRIQAIGKPADALQPEEIATVLNQDDLTALQHGGPYEIEHQHLANSPHGARLLRVIKVPIYDQRRMATHLFCLAEDITERTHAEQSVRREHALLRGLIDSLPDLISFKSHAGAYLGCNKAFEEFTGLQEKDFLGRTDEVLFQGLNMELPPKIDRTILTDAQPRWRAVELHLPDGRTAHLNTVETPLRGPLGEVWGILAVSQVAAITDSATK